MEAISQAISADSDRHCPMPILENERFEAFAQHLARGKSKTQAALDAGYPRASASAQGCRISQRANVQQRVLELRELLDQERTRALVAVEMPTREFVLRKLVGLHDRAEKAGNGTLEARVLELIGKEIGMFVTRVEANVNNPLAGLAPEAVIALSRFLAGEAALPVEGEAQPA